MEGNYKNATTYTQKIAEPNSISVLEGRSDVGNKLNDKDKSQIFENMKTRIDVFFKITSVFFTKRRFQYQWPEEYHW